MGEPKSESCEIIAIPQPLGLFAGELLQRAGEYADAFERLEVASNKRFLHVGYYLVSHAAELTLKAFLAAKGVPKAELWSRRLGHDLAALEKAVAHHRLPTVENLHHLIWSLGMMNDGHALRYPSGYFSQVPDPGECLLVVRELMRSAGPAVASARISAQLRLAADPRYKGKRLEWSD